MQFSTQDLIGIQELPDFLRTDHCYNDMQHAMLVILFRHALVALDRGEQIYADKVIDNATLYLYIHFLNEEEGMVYKTQKGWSCRDELAEHSEKHLRFLDFWRDEVLVPHKNRTVDFKTTSDGVTQFYNLIIQHIGETDIPTYGPDAITVEQTRNELARVAQTNMPMSPFMAGAFDTVKILAPDIARILDRRHLSPQALHNMGELDLVQNGGRILSGQTGSLRDRFAGATHGDLSAAESSPLLYAA